MDDEIEVHPPQGSAPGTHPVTLNSATLASAPFDLTLIAAPFQVAVQNYVVGNQAPFAVYAAQGQLPSSSFVVLGSSQEPLPSVSTARARSTSATTSRRCSPAICAGSTRSPE